MIAALQVLAVIQSAQRPVSEVCNMFEAVPQFVRNVEVLKPINCETGVVKQAIIQSEQKLRNTGRILVRHSGTEPLIRIMAEGDDVGLVSQIIDDVEHEVRKAMRH